MRWPFDRSVAVHTDPTILLIDEVLSIGDIAFQRTCLDRIAQFKTRRMLKPGGKVIFSVPFSLDGETREHYPDLSDWSLTEQDGRWTLTNRTQDRRVQTFTDLVFHGGPGSTLEMRLFVVQ